MHWSIWSQHKASESKELLSQEGDSRPDNVEQGLQLPGSWPTPRYRVKRQEGN